MLALKNNFLDIITQKDKELLIYLNNLGSEQWDAFWLAITDKFNWIPLFAFILFLVFKQFGLKKGTFTFLFLILLVAFSDQFTNLIKALTERTRPCNVPEIQEYLRQFTYRPRGYSFWSGHASLSTTFTVFCILLFRKNVKYIYFMLLFPLLFGYSRIYLRVHYPLDVFSGYVSGIIIGFLLYKLYCKILPSKLM